MKLKTTFLLLILGFSFSACSDFLNVTPKDKQTADQLFSTKSGFYTAANGIYDELASEALYGAGMTWETIDIISKRYAPNTANTAFSDLCANNYTSSYASPKLSSIWENAYKTIMAANLLIEQLEQQKALLTTEEVKLMKGEMLAVRAFLHLDMARLFGPRWNNNPDELSIPYNETTQVTTLPLLPFSMVMENIIRDLNDAEELLSNDPIIANGPMASEVEGESIQLRYRQFRFNYYTVIALKARAYLWGGDKTNALIEAKRILTDPTVAKHFPSVDPNQLLANNTNPDRVFSSEVLSGVYVKDRDQIFNNYFASTAPLTNRLQPRSDYISGQYSLFSHQIFSSETQDYRYQTQWEVASGVGNSGHSFIKFKPIDRPDPEDEDSEYFYSKMIPLVKLAELYYIATECEPTVGDALKWYNQIRNKRGCSTLPESMSSIISQLGGWGMLLANEYAREFHGEGQFFFFCKRVEIITGYGAGLVYYTENGEALDYPNLVIQPPLPEGEMK